jgi:hypothetical protein
MAKKFIFVKNLEDKMGSLYRIAKNDQELNSFNLFIENYKIIEVTDEDWNNVVTNSKQAISYNSNNIISYEDLDISISDEFSFVKEIELRVNIIEKNIEKYNDSSLKSSWITYKNYLLSLDPRGREDVTYPINSSIEKIAVDNGIEIFHPLQFPI